LGKKRDGAWWVCGYGWGQKALPSERRPPNTRWGGGCHEFEREEVEDGRRHGKGDRGVAAWVEEK